MTVLEWWLLGGSTAAGLVTVFRWQALAVAHAVRGAWLRLRDVGVDPIARHRLYGLDVVYDPPVRIVRETDDKPNEIVDTHHIPYAGLGPTPRAADGPWEGHLIACGCEPGSDPADCPTRRDVTRWAAREREYLHGGPPEPGGRPGWVRSVDDG